MNTLDLLSIHEWDIDTTVERIEDVFNELKLNIDDLEERTMQSLVGQTITEDLGQQIIMELLETARNMLLEQVAPYEPEIEIYVNGMDSRFYIPESDKDIIKAVKNTACDYEYVKWLHDQIPFYQDFEGFIENDSMYHEALQHLMETETDLYWDETDLLNTDPEKLEEAYLADPYNLDKVYLLGASGKCYARCYTIGEQNV